MPRRTAGGASWLTPAVRSFKLIREASFISNLGSDGGHTLNTVNNTATDVFAKEIFDIRIDLKNCQHVHLPCLG